MVQSLTGLNGKRKHRARFGNSALGRRSQIQSKLGHGIRGISPVLLGAERQADWELHYEGICRALNPGNEFEADLVFLIAWQLWRFGRLIRHETALSTEKIHKPPLSIFDAAIGTAPLTKETILTAITKLEGERTNGDSRNGARSKQPEGDPLNSLLSRCRSIETRASDVMFAPSEVREILRLVLEQVRSSAEEQTNEAGGNEEDALCEEFAIEERPWTAGEIAEQIQILSDAAGGDWREELS